MLSLIKNIRIPFQRNFKSKMIHNSCSLWEILNILIFRWKCRDSQISTNCQKNCFSELKINWSRLHTSFGRLSNSKTSWLVALISTQKRTKFGLEIKSFPSLKRIKSLNKLNKSNYLSAAFNLRIFWMRADNKVSSIAFVKWSMKILEKWGFKDLKN